MIGAPPCARRSREFLRSGAQAIWGADFHLVKDPLVQGRIVTGGVFIGVPQLVASGGALLAFGLLYWFITRTETGLALQATAQDRQAASLMGIDTQRMFALGWAIGGACVGVAGALLTTFFYVFPEVGGPFALLAYVAVKTPWPELEQPVWRETTATIGDALLSTYLLPFEILSVVILAALVGAVIMARKEIKD